MKDIRIDGRMQRVFVLKEREDKTVYIPLKALNRVDYERLLEMEKEGGEMLKTMEKKTLPNGRNALELYDDVIQVVRRESEKEGIRVKKPEESEYNAAVQKASEDAKEQSRQAEASQSAASGSSEEAPVKRGRGRPRKNPQ